MRAIRFETFGDPLVLKSTQASDVKNVAGAMKQTTLPRIPGRDFAGLVEAGPATRVGLRKGSTLDAAARSGLPLRLRAG
jgi:NADPH:quinone reductase